MQRIEEAFTCARCERRFTIPGGLRLRYPDWTPKLCKPCSEEKRGGSRSSPATARPASPRSDAASLELNLTLEQVLARFTGGPREGVFTDGACSGNPGPGGWGAVLVRDGKVVDQRYGHDRETTNNRMELAALIAGYEMLASDAETTIFSDSQLCVRTINEWAAGWEKRGWRRKTGPVKNLELVKRAYELARAHPKVELRWIKAHNGSRWNEYADSLATAYLRDTL